MTCSAGLLALFSELRLQSLRQNGGLRLAGHDAKKDAVARPSQSWDASIELRNGPPTYLVQNRGCQPPYCDLLGYVDCSPSIDSNLG